MNCEANVLDHLAGVELDHEDTFLALGCLADCLGGEWPEGDGADDAYLDALFGCEFACFVGDTCDCTECDDEVICVFDRYFLPAGLVLLDLTVACLKLVVDDLHLS